MRGLVRDGIAFARTGGYKASSDGTHHFEDQKPLLRGSVAKKTWREKCEAIRAKQKPARVGKQRTAMHEAAMIGSVKLLKRVVAAEKKELDNGDARGCTAFHLAWAGNHFECVKKC